MYSVYYSSFDRTRNIGGGVGGEWLERFNPCRKVQGSIRFMIWIKASSNRLSIK